MVLCTSLAATACYFRKISYGYLTRSAELVLGYSGLKEAGELVFGTHIVYEENNRITETVKSSYLLFSSPKWKHIQSVITLSHPDSSAHFRSRQQNNTVSCY